MLVGSIGRNETGWPHVSSVVKEKNTLNFHSDYIIKCIDIDFMVAIVNDSSKYMCTALFLPNLA